MYFICVDNRPFYTVERRGFKKFIKTIAPLYKVPSKDNIKSKIDAKYELMYLSYKRKLTKIEHICLTCDIWSEMMTTRSFLGVTAHFVNESQERRSIILDVKELNERHTADYIVEQLNRILTFRYQ